MRFVPAGFDNERHREFAMWRAGAFHDPADDLGGVLDLGFRRLEQQFVMDLQQLRACNFSRASVAGMRAIARLMMSAAEPCSGALIACRSAPARRAGLTSRMPGIQHLRPKIVST